MSDTVTFRDLMESNAADSIDETAVRVEAALRLSKLQRQVLHVMIRDAVRLEWRNATRLVEPRVSGGTPAAPAQDRADYVGERFALGDGRYVLWGEATVDDHRQRIDMLAKLRLGLERTIAAHEDAVAQILAADVKCLNDLAEVAA